MAQKVTPGPVKADTMIREAVCVHTRKIYDSCRDKDCCEDLPVYMGPVARGKIAAGGNLRPKSAQLLWVDTNVEELTFHRGFFTVDVRFYYKITGEVINPLVRAEEFSGLAVYEKRAILFGSEGTAKVFTSEVSGLPGTDGDNPIAVVEAVDPILLSLTASEPMGGTPGLPEIPGEILALLGETEGLEIGEAPVTVTLGQFSILRLERDTHLLIPAYDYCMPEKECAGGGEDDPCTLFSHIDFPVDEFFPPDTMGQPEGYREALENQCR